MGRHRPQVLARAQPKGLFNESCLHPLSRRQRPPSRSSKEDSRLRETPQVPRLPSDPWRCVCLSFCPPTPLDPRGKALGQYKGSRCPVSVATGECAPWQPPTQPDLSVPVALATVVTSSLLLLHTPQRRSGEEGGNRVCWGWRIWWGAGWWGRGPRELPDSGGPEGPHCPFSCLPAPDETLGVSQPRPVKEVWCPVLTILPVPGSPLDASLSPTPAGTPSPTPHAVLWLEALGMTPAGGFP